MSIWTDISGAVGSAYGWVGKQARVLPGVGGFMEATGSSIEAILSGGTVQTTLPGEPTQQYGSGAASPALPGTDPLSVVKNAKIAGVPVLPVTIALAVSWFLFKR